MNPRMGFQLLSASVEGNALTASRNLKAGLRLFPNRRNCFAAIFTLLNAA